EAAQHPGVVVGGAGDIRVVDVIGRDVLEVARERVEAEPTGRVDVTQTNAPGSRERAGLHRAILPGAPGRRTGPALCCPRGDDGRGVPPVTARHAPRA